ncbi:MAG: DUF4349 domain-containing protein [Lachnospiraceae bacterium]|nr:DUF4349 domain-containing protein [Lachnospiraceae bacterium]
MQRKAFCIAMIMSLTVILSACGGSSSTKGSSPSYADTTVMSESAYDGGYSDYDYAGEAYEAGDYPEEGLAERTGGEGENVEVTEGVQTNRKLIRTVNLNIETYDFEGITSRIASRVTALGGYVESSSVDGNTSSSDRSADYTLRIPAASADSFIASIGSDSNITHQSENMEDVTLQYVDINSRKESLQVEYSRLEELLKDAKDVEELIYIESRMSEVRYQIESIESQLRSYDNKVDYTTVYLYVREVQKYTEPEPVDNSVGARITRGWKNAFENIIQFLQDLIVLIAVSLPYLILIALLILAVVAIIWLIRRIVKKIGPSKKKQQRMQQMHPGQPYGQSYTQVQNNMNRGVQPQTGFMQTKIRQTQESDPGANVTDGAPAADNTQDTGHEQ